jgi:hypothetical protein
MDLNDEELKATREMKAINKIVAGDEKTADEMFEELGYKKEVITWKEDNQIHYIIYKSDDTEIEFSMKTRYLIVTHLLTVSELKAIYKKYEELGWL